jgi:hypothetical protein
MPLNQPSAVQVRAAARELTRRPRPIRADLDPLGRLPSPVERATRRVEDLYPTVAAAVPRSVLEAAARGLPGDTGWQLADVIARRHGQPEPDPRNQVARSLLGAPGRGYYHARTRRLVAALVAAARGEPSPGITVEQTHYNRQRGAALRIPPERMAHLTTPTVPAARRRP